MHSSSLNIFELSCSIVLYKNDPSVVRKAIDSVIGQSLNIKLFIFDNSPTDLLRTLCEINSNITYIHEPKNVGFGKGHNTCIKKGLENCNYHLIMNPDVYFDSGVMAILIEKLKEEKEIGLIAPRILYPDGTIQTSCRKLPSPFELIVRRISLLSLIFDKWISSQNLEFIEKDSECSPPFILGCFMLIPKAVFEKIGYFDDGFFMYMEDVDLTRRIKSQFKTLYFPVVSVYHSYERGSSKKINLLIIHIKSAIFYFNKWGWFFDKQRKHLNKNTSI